MKIEGTSDAQHLKRLNCKIFAQNWYDILQDWRTIGLCRVRVENGQHLKIIPEGLVRGFKKNIWHPK